LAALAGQLWGAEGGGANAAVLIAVVLLKLKADFVTGLAAVELATAEELGRIGALETTIHFL